MYSDREFMFELKEIKTRRDKYGQRDDYVHITQGTVSIKGEEITVMINDEEQPHGIFVANDGLFKKLIKKIHEFTK